MKKVILFVFLFIFSAVFVFAQEKAEEIPVGMEAVQIGSAKDVKAIVPKGSKIHKEGGVIFQENIERYMSRKFLEMEERIETLEMEEEKINKEIEQLKKVLSEIQSGETNFEDTQ